MTSFDKALEVAAKYHVRESDECEVMDDYSAHEDTFKAGATWSRQFTVQEVIDFMREKSNAFLVCEDADRYKIGLHWSIHADAIEKHFKDRGGE